MRVFLQPPSLRNWGSPVSRFRRRRNLETGQRNKGPPQAPLQPKVKSTFALDPQNQHHRVSRGPLTGGQFQGTPPLSFPPSCVRPVTDKDCSNVTGCKIGTYIRLCGVMCWHMHFCVGCEVLSKAGCSPGVLFLVRGRVNREPCQEEVAATFRDLRNLPIFVRNFCFAGFAVETGLLALTSTLPFTHRTHTHRHSITTMAPKMIDLDHSSNTLWEIMLIWNGGKKMQVRLASLIASIIRSRTHVAPFAHSPTAVQAVPLTAEFRDSSTAHDARLSFTVMCEQYDSIMARCRDGALFLASVW